MPAPSLGLVGAYGTKRLHEVLAKRKERELLERDKEFERRYRAGRDVETDRARTAQEQHQMDTLAETRRQNMLAEIANASQETRLREADARTRAQDTELGTALGQLPEPVRPGATFMRYNKPGAQDPLPKEPEPDATHQEREIAAHYGKSSIRELSPEQRAEGLTWYTNLTSRPAVTILGIPGQPYQAVTTQGGEVKNVRPINEMTTEEGDTILNTPVGEFQQQKATQTMLPLLQRMKIMSDRLVTKRGAAQTFDAWQKGTLNQFLGNEPEFAAYMAFHGMLSVVTQAAIQDSRLSNQDVELIGMASVVNPFKVKSPEEAAYMWQALFAAFEGRMSDEGKLMLGVPLSPRRADGRYSNKLEALITESLQTVNQATGKPYTRDEVLAYLRAQKVIK